LAPLLAAASPPAGASRPAHPIWSPGGVQVTPSVPGQAASRVPTRPQTPAQGLAARPLSIPKVSWPSGSATAALGTTPSRAGSLPVALASADGAASAAAVSFASHDAALKAGVSGALFTVAAASSVQVTLDYSSFAAAYGGGYGSRLTLVSLPACALTTP